MEHAIGHSIHALATDLWPINRSLTGEGVRQTLRKIQRLVPALKIHEVPSNSPVFDWRVPNEWDARAAWIEGPDGERVVDFADHNLHLVGYSAPVDTWLTLEELQPRLYSLPEKPDAIPYVTSYYCDSWGFCLRHRDRERLVPGRYRVVVDTTLAPGSLSYGEVVLPGRTSEEVLLSTYVCHPSMANNELSGPCLVTYLTKWLSDLASRRYTYRVVFLPETIGSITYLSRHLDHLKPHLVAGFNVTCVGDERAYSYLPSRSGDTLADRVVLHVLKHHAGEFRRYSFLDRGSDERQYCAPGVDLPVVTMSRSLWSYPEYHTSLDDLTLVTPAGLEGSYRAYQRAILALEEDWRPRVTTLCEPQLGRRGLYPQVTAPGYLASVTAMMNLIAYSDGTRTLLEIADAIGVPIWELSPISCRLREHGVLADA